MSGGLDSSMAACLLKQQGFDVFGLTMKTWNGAVPAGGAQVSACYGPGEEEDLAQAAGVCRRLGIEHFVIDLSEEFRREVLDYFRSEYLAGRTPNPCMRCNHSIKFGALLAQARRMQLKFDYFATGHYARVGFDPATGRYLLKKGRDEKKDQSYFLSRLEQEQLAQLIFPLGDFSKLEVRRRAENLGWGDLAQKAESQDFLDGGNYGLLFEEDDARPGPIVDQEGRRVGEHRGIIHYTIGQRKGLVGGAAEPQYVSGIDSAGNTIQIGPRRSLMCRGLIADRLNWISIKEMAAEELCITAKVRYKHCAAPAVVGAEGDGANGRVRVVFDEPQAAVAPGQIVAFYSGESVVGSGVIERPIKIAP